jgi:hypothetical protein
MSRRLGLLAALLRNGLRLPSDAKEVHDEVDVRISRHAARRTITKRFDVR